MLCHRPNRCRQAQFGVSRSWNRATGIAGAVDCRDYSCVAGDAARLDSPPVGIGGSEFPESTRSQVVRVRCWELHGRGLECM